MGTLARKDFHNIIADYFSIQPLFLKFQNEKLNREISPFFNGDLIYDTIDHAFAPRPYNKRRIEEQPWQFRASTKWHKLYALLSDLLFFQAVWDYREYEVEAYWRELQTFIKFAMPQAYEDVISHPDKYASRLLWGIGRLLSENHFPQEAVAIQKCLIIRHNVDPAFQILAISNLAQTLSRLGETDQALEIANKLVEDMTLQGLSFATSPLLYELGRIYYFKSNYKEAIQYLRKASLQCRIGMKWSEDLFGQILVYRALAHGGLGELDASRRLTIEGVNEFRKCQSKKNLAWALSVNGLILKKLDNKKAAYEAWYEALNIYNELQDLEKIDKISIQISDLNMNE